MLSSWRNVRLNIITPCFVQGAHTYYKMFKTYSLQLRYGLGSELAFLPMYLYILYHNSIPPTLNLQLLAKPGVKWYMPINELCIHVVRAWDDLTADMMKQSRGRSQIGFDCGYPCIKSRKRYDRGDPSHEDDLHGCLRCSFECSVTSQTVQNMF